jgi:hypothetical protein
MTGRLIVTALLAAFPLLLGTPPVRAAEEILKLVPNSASGFAVINRPGGLDAKLQALGREMQLPVPSLLIVIKQQLGIGESLEEKGTVGVVLLPPGEGVLPIPVPILLVPVTDYAKFLRPLKPESETGGLTKITVRQTQAWVRSINGYAAIASAQHREALEKLKLAPKIPAALTPWRKWLIESSIVMHARGGGGFSRARSGGGRGRSCL